MSQAAQDALDRDDKDRAGPEVRLIYQDQLNNIRDQKSRQWSITYYALLLYGVLFALVRLKDLPVEFTASWSWFFSVAALFPLAVLGMMVASVWFLIRTQRALRFYRIVAEELRERCFSDWCNQALDEALKKAPPPAGDDPRSYSYDLSAFYVMAALCVLGGALVIWLGSQAPT